MEDLHRTGTGRTGRDGEDCTGQDGDSRGTGAGTGRHGYGTGDRDVDGDRNRDGDGRWTVMGQDGDRPEERRERASLGVRDPSLWGDRGRHAPMDAHMNKLISH